MPCKVQYSIFHYFRFGCFACLAIPISRDDGRLLLHPALWEILAKNYGLNRGSALVAMGKVLDGRLDRAVVVFLLMLLACFNYGLVGWLSLEDRLGNGMV